MCIRDRTAPYFYEEDNYADDMELAAVELYKLTRDPKYLQYALEFGRLEPVTPWMGADTATVSYTHLRAHETVLDLVCRLLLEKKKTKQEKLTYERRT